MCVRVRVDLRATISKCVGLTDNFTVRWKHVIELVQLVYVAWLLGGAEEGGSQQDKLSLSI